MSRVFNLWRERLEDPRPLIVAHRGDSAHAPENTLEAARLAFEKNAEAWEFDVRLTRDGRPVVFHDAHLSRTTDAPTRLKKDLHGSLGPRVADLDLAEILELDAGSWFLDPSGGPRTAACFGTADRLSEAIRSACRSRSVRVPTLEQALRLSIESNRLANVELKIDGDEGNRLIDAVLAAIGELGAEHRVLVSSFDHEAVATVARRCPSIATGALSGQPLLDPGRYAREWVGADAYHASLEALGTNRSGDRIGRSGSSRDVRLEPFESLRRSAVPLLVFTINDQGANGPAHRLIAAGASGLFSDFPSEIRSIVEAPKGENRRKETWRSGLETSRPATDLFGRPGIADRDDESSLI